MSQTETINMNQQTIEQATRHETNALRNAGNTTIEKLIEVSERFDAMKKDHIVHAKNVHWDEEGLMNFETRDDDDMNQLFNPGETAVRNIQLSPDVLAFRHMCTKLGDIPPGYLLNKCTPDIRAINMNHQHSKQPDDKQWLIRGFDDRARAVVSDGCHAINNTDVLRMTHQLLSESNLRYQLIRPLITPHTLIMKIRVADTPDGNYGIGIEVRNGEITNYKLGVFPFLQRNSCTNSIVYHDAGWQQRHNAHSDAGLRAAFKDNAGRALGIPSDMINRVVEAEIAEIPSLSDVLDGMCEKHQFNKSVRDLIAIGTEGQSTVMGVVNGVSYAAHVADDETLNDDQRTKMEHLAGNLLMGDFFKVAMKDLNDDAGVDEARFAFVR